MKFRLVLVASALFPMLSWGQTQAQKETDEVKFYTAAPMYVGYSSGVAAADKGKTASTVLFIDGSVKVVSGASIAQKGRMEITRDFYNALDPAKGKNNLFVNKANTPDDGVVAFVGLVTGDSKNRRQAQFITRSVDVTAYDGQKKLNYISFPTLRVEKNTRGTAASEPAVTDADVLALDPYGYGYLKVDTTVAMVVDYIKVDKTNRLVLDASYDANYVPTQAKINSAQVLLKNVHPDLLADAEAYASYSQLNLAMYNRNDLKSNTFPNTLRKSDKVNWLTGFTPPFKNMAADYMYYQVLVKPDATSVHSNKGPIMNPYYQMQAGLGYFSGMDVTTYEYDQIDTHWGVNRKNRAVGNYVFSRKMYEDNITSATNYFPNIANPNVVDPDAGNLAMGTGPMANFSRYSYLTGTEVDPSTIPTGGEWHGKTDHYLMKNETFSTGEVLVNLKTGLNFLGNPFMAPISLNCLLGWGNEYVDGNNLALVPETTAEAGFEVDLLTPAGAATKVKASHIAFDPASVDLRSKYWLINEATVQHYQEVYAYKVSYDFISREAGATLGAGTVGTGVNPFSLAPETYLVAPMQMFLLQSNKDIQIALKPGLATFGSTAFKKTSAPAVEHKDWFVVEMENVADGSKDRTSIIFREKAKMDYENDPYDTRKGVTPKLEEETASYVSLLKSTNDNVAEMGLIYTKSNEGVKMLGNAIPTTVKELPLYTTPPATQQQMKLNFYGLENLHAVDNVWLIDRYENAKIKVQSGDVYEYTSGPSDLKEFAGENRFVLKFYDSDDNEPLEEIAPITCYYNTSTLYISNLIEDDLGSRVQIYDMQGRLMGETKVKEFPSDQYTKPLSFGTYVVKITGKRNSATKFINLQN